MDKNSAALYKKMQAEIELYQNVEKTRVKIVKQCAMLESQLNENQCVLDELNLLSPENKVYKLFGPVLVKQELEESRQNVGKRIEYITKELKSSSDSLENTKKELVKHREAVVKYQQQWQVAAAME